MKIRTYREMIKLPTFEERFEYLRIGGSVGFETFGAYRYINQAFYTQNPRWKSTRHKIIVRDEAYDLAVKEPIHEICPNVIFSNGKEIKVPTLVIHHITPLTLEDIEYDRDICYDPDNLVVVHTDTHKAIHYGDKRLLPSPFTERRPNDTIPWR